ncbi:MAG: Pleiotropic regulatory protein degT [Herbinix sp.]|nr:Pleiotropic regulatory protein degT [Herbinix sp.]
MHIIAILQARMSSTRLPGKVLLPLGDKTLIEQIVARIRAVDKISELIVATTVNPMDDFVEELCVANKIVCFRGSEENVLERFYFCADKYKADVIVRLTADDPLKDPDVILKAIELFETGQYDYVSNTIHPTFPEGIDVEVFSFQALKKAYEESILPSEKEHVTPYIYKNKEKFKLYNFEHECDISELRWTVDSQEDYQFMKCVYEELYKNPNDLFSMQEVLELLKRKPELSDINKGHRRNEGYLKSLKLEEKIQAEEIQMGILQGGRPEEAKEEAKKEIKKEAKKEIKEEEKDEIKENNNDKEEVSVAEIKEENSDRTTEKMEADEEIDKKEDEKVEIDVEEVEKLVDVNHAVEAKENEDDIRSIEINDIKDDIPKEVSVVEKRIYGNELTYVKEVLDSEFRSSKGAVMMQRLEKAFCEKFGVKYAISCVNGTATLHAILEALNITVGDEVIVPPLTMSSTTFAVLQANATPVYADVDWDTFLITADSIKKCITSKTKAIITVSLYGLSPDMDAIMELANRHHLYVIEDNAECMLGTYRNRKVGTLGHVASYSFQSSKHITSGEGGMIITDSLEIAEGVRRVNSLGYAGVGASKAKITKQTIQDPDYERHVSMGWNYRMPELCAAVALAQFEQVELLVSRRSEVAKLYLETIKDTDWLIPQKVSDEYECTYWTFVVKLEHPEITWKEFRDQFAAFGGDGIYAAWKLSYLEPMMRNRKLLKRERFISRRNLHKYKKGLCPVAEYLQGKLLQFKTNYWNLEAAKAQMQILKKTIQFFEDRSVAK